MKAKTKDFIIARESNSTCWEEIGQSQGTSDSAMEEYKKIIENAAHPEQIRILENLNLRPDLEDQVKETLI